MLESSPSTGIIFTKLLQKAIPLQDHSIFSEISTPACVDIAIVGGGASGFFAAIACAEANPNLAVWLIEGSRKVLTKVRISGGGRCNVTHNCLDTQNLLSGYPRGAKELRQVFSRFQVQDTLAWFAKRGVTIVAEADGRMFSSTNTSETIVHCLQDAAKAAGVKLLTGCIVKSIERLDQGFLLKLGLEKELVASKVLLATGSAPQGLAMAESLGHSIVPLVPSLFTFKVTDPRIADLAGLSVPAAQASLSFPGFSKKIFQQKGPLLITHWGFSGPGILKLSAWAARELAEAQYQANLKINWLADLSPADLAGIFAQQKQVSGKKTIYASSPFSALSKRLWHSFLNSVSITSELTWGEASKSHLTQLSEALTRASYTVSGKGVFKDEFVSCGGVSLKEVDFKTMQSRLCPDLYFTGEILDIDGITGGYNFQNAWSTGWIAGTSLALTDGAN